MGRVGGFVFWFRQDCRRVGHRGRVSRVVSQIWLHCGLFNNHDQSAITTGVGFRLARTRVLFAVLLITLLCPHSKCDTTVPVFDRPTRANRSLRKTSRWHPRIFGRCHLSV